MEADSTRRSLLLFKALSDPARLRILGLLAERPPPDTSWPTGSSHAADDLPSHATARRRPTCRRRARRAVPHLLTAYRYDPRAPQGSVLIDGTSQPASEEETRASRVFDGPRLRQIPGPEEASHRPAPPAGTICARPGLPGSGGQRLLREAHDDVATLRRELVDYGFMVRDRGIYRIATELPARGSTVAQEVGNEQAWFEELVALRRLHEPSTAVTGLSC